MKLSLRTTTGLINYPDKSAQVMVFLSPRGNFKEAILAQATKTYPELVTRPSFPRISSSINGGRKEVCGSVTDSEYLVESGSILRVYIKINKGYGRLPESACFYIRVRSGAAYRRVEINTLQSLSAVFTKAVFEGCFDMLSFDEAIAEGVKTNKNFRRLFEPINVNRVISKNEVLIEQTEVAEKKEVVVLENPDTGKEVTVVKFRKRRAIDV